MTPRVPASLAAVERVRDADEVSRFMEAWINWEAGAIAPITQGLLGASVRSDSVDGYLTLLNELGGAASKT